MVRYRDILRYFGFIFMNEAEARALSGQEPADYRAWPEIMRKAGLSGGVITRGRDAVIAWSDAGAAQLVPPPLQAIGDVTGAGDGFAAGFLHAVVENETLEQAVTCGAAIARLTLASEMATAEELTRDLLAETLGLVPMAEIVL